MGCAVIFFALCSIVLYGMSRAGDTAVTLSEFVDESKGNGSFYLPKELFSVSESTVSANRSTTLNDTTTIQSVNFTDISRIGLLNDTVAENKTSVVFIDPENSTSESYTPEHENFSEDLTVTDSAGCFTVKRDQLEERCYNKFENVILNVDTEDEAKSRKEVCCAVEEYEKCSLNGFKTTNCNVDHKELKETLKAARIFMGAMTNISCSKHRGMCAAAAASGTYASGFLMVASFFFVFL